MDSREYCEVEIIGGGRDTFDLDYGRNGMEWNGMEWNE